MINLQNKEETMQANITKAINRLNNGEFNLALDIFTIQPLQKKALKN
ncbi:MAG: hypothetical protein ACI9VT_000130 [Psychroserpens sp.]